MDELIGEFVSETRETLEHIGEALVGWEAHPDDPARLDEIFRFVHTVKGSCGFLDLPRIGALAHAAETVLGDVRAGRRLTDSQLVGAMLAIIDRISVLSEAIGTDNEVPDPSDDVLLVAALDHQGVATSSANAADPAPLLLKQARNIRVSVDVLETAMTQVSDLVLARNDLARRLRDSDADTATAAAFDRVSSAISDVRETVARTRMQPIERLFALLPRLVRDTASAVGKEVQLRIEGSDVEIDREMIEAIRDPLTHIVRNAIDHGIEFAGDREKAGKNRCGTLTVTARQSGNQVSIMIADDGRGIDVARLIERAVLARLVTPAKAAMLSPEAALNLMFEAGLSTADNITEISGRGVGMDVVRANVERLGGAITIDNRPGAGLAITVRAPLTLSIMNALLVEAGGHVFALPRAAIHEIVSIKSQSVRVEAVGGGCIAVVRGRMLSVVSLAPMLGLREEALSHLVIVDPPGGNRFAMGVTHVRDHEELVVRPTAPQVAALGTYAGQSLPDDGIPVLVLDPTGIAVRAGISNDRIHTASAEVSVAAETPGSLLVLDGLDGQRRAVRVTDIGHIDDVDVADFAGQDDNCYVSLFGELIPVIIDGTLPASGRVALLRMADHNSGVGYPVAEVHDLLPIPPIADVSDGLVEGYVMIEGRAVPLMAWPRARSETNRRKRRA